MLNIDDKLLIMESTAEKVNMAQWILSLTDDFVIEKVAKSLEKLRTEIEAEQLSFDHVRYSDIKSNKFDFEKIKEEQGVVPFKEGELDRLIAEADIQEPIEVLLASID